MLQERFDILSEILDDFKRELSDLNAEIYFNRLNIREIEERKKELDDDESDDFKIFSPRSMTDQFRERIKSVISSKVEYEKKNDELEAKKEKLQEKIDKLENLIRQEKPDYSVLTVQEKDRQRIARELHDTSLQNLTHLIHLIELCRMYIDDDPKKAKTELSLIRSSLGEIIVGIRNTIFDLRPVTFDDLSFKAVFELLLEKICGKNDYEIISDIDNVSCENEITLLHLYRVVQEGLINIVKHAKAKKIIFRCKVINSFCFVDLEDDGQGFNADDLEEDNRFGLSLMRERIEELNGKLNISSVRGEGTKIHIEIPI